MGCLQRLGEQAKQGRDDILCDPDVDPVVVELPDVEEEDVGGLSKRGGLVYCADGESQDDILAVAGDQLVVWGVACAVGGAVGRAQPGLVFWQPPDGPDDGVGEPSPGSRCMVVGGGMGARSVVRGGKRERGAQQQQAQDGGGRRAHGGGMERDAVGCRGTSGM